MPSQDREEFVAPKSRIDDEGNEDLDESALNSRWEESFMRLVEYKEKYGHCLVPNRYTEDPHLGSWGELKKVYVWIKENRSL
jgi:hypothetical protein